MDREEMELAALRSCFRKQKEKICSPFFLKWLAILLSGEQKSWYQRQIHRIELLCNLIEDLLMINYTHRANHYMGMLQIIINDLEYDLELDSEQVNKEL